MRLFAGDVMITSGEAIICGFSVKSDLSEIRKHLGYCPQFDAIIDDLTGREMMYLFARLRGIPESKLKSAVNEAAENLLLTEHLDKKCGKYR